jgi:hypothetical protein
MKYVYFVVEGQHDIAAIGRILKVFHEAKQINNERNLDPFWRRLVPNRFPYKGYLLGRVPVPAFFQTKESSIAIHSSGGESDLIKTLKNTLNNLDQEELSAIALFCDADKKNAFDYFKELTKKLNDLPPFTNLSAPGQVSRTRPRTGIHVFPDNRQGGTLETVLLECASITYSDLLEEASKYIDNINQNYKEKWRPFDNLKAKVGCIANVLKPGKSNQVSIQDNDWICSKTEANPSLSMLKNFIEELLE